MTSPAIPILLGGVVVWSLYRRVRRNIGRQLVRRRRKLFSIVIFTVVSAGLLVTSFSNPRLLLGLAGGLALGAGLGRFGLRLTRFETTDEGHFYTPNTFIGIALSLLFIGRLAWRFWSLRELETSSRHPALMQSPLTFFLFGLIAGYYVIYYLGLFARTRPMPAVAQNSFARADSALDSPRDRS